MIVHVSGHVIILLQVCVQFLSGSSVEGLKHVWKQVRIWVSGCLAHTTLMASDDISFIPQAQSCSLLQDKSPNISVKPFCHTTHIEGLYEKMISVVFFLTPMK